MEADKHQDASGQLAGGDFQNASQVNRSKERKSLVSNEEDTNTSYGAVNSAQGGVKTIEAISTTWDKRSLILAYISYVLVLTRMRVIKHLFKYQIVDCRQCNLS
jgi:hypothetical protein